MLVLLGLVPPVLSMAFLAVAAAARLARTQSAGLALRDKEMRAATADQLQTGAAAAVVGPVHQEATAPAQQAATAVLASHRLLLAHLSPMQVVVAVAHM